MVYITVFINKSYVTISFENICLYIFFLNSCFIKRVLNIDSFGKLNYQLMNFSSRNRIFGKEAYIPPCASIGDYIHCVIPLSVDVDY